jgi:hypothetical protein
MTAGHAPAFRKWISVESISSVRNRVGESYLGEDVASGCVSTTHSPYTSVVLGKIFSKKTTTTIGSTKWKYAKRVNPLRILDESSLRILYTNHVERVNLKLGRNSIRIRILGSRTSVQIDSINSSSGF